MPEPTILTNIRWPIELYDRLKAYQDDRGLSFNAAINELAAVALDVIENNIKTDK